MSHMQEEEMVVEVKGDLVAQESERDGKRNELPRKILLMIFHDFSVADLLSVSLVSKHWQKISRHILKNSRECYAHIRKFKLDVPALNHAIGYTGLMNFANGLHFELEPDRDLSDCDNEDYWSNEHDSYSTLDQDIPQCAETRRELEEAKGKLPHLLSAGWSFVTLQAGDANYWVTKLSKMDALLLSELIFSANQSLQKLTFGEDDDSYFLPGCTQKFPQLKTVHFREECEFGLQESFFCRFPPCAPNLQEISGAMWKVGSYFEQRNDFVLTRIKNLDLASCCLEGEDDLLEILSSLARLDRLKLDRYLFLPKEIQFSVVQKSLMTLVELDVRTYVFYDLCTGLECNVEFPNLRRLGLTTGRNVPLGREMAVWKELWKLCPNLEQLQFSRDSKNAAEEEEEGEEIPEVPSLDGSDQCQLPLEIQLKWQDEPYYEEDFEFLSKVYPNCHKLEMIGWALHHDNAFDISSIFLHFHSLEYLEFSKSSSTELGNIDALLCGINIEEAELSMDPTFVPVRPSIWNAKNLLEVKITGEVRKWEVRVNQSWLIQVTEKIPVRRSRLLKVTLEGGQYWLNQLRGVRGLPACTTLLRAQVSNEAP